MRGRGRYPGLAVLALAWVGGGTLALAGSTLIPLWILAVATGIALLGSLRLRFVLVIAVALAGGLWTTQAARRGLDARLPRAFEGQTLTVVGRVVGLPRNQPRRVRFTLAIDTAQSAHGAGVDGLRRIALSWYRPPATIPRVGERWRFQVRLQRPRSLRNPGSFDYAGWAFAHGINATGYVYHNHGIRLAPAGAGLGPVRARIARAVNRALPASPWAGLVAGLAVGARGGMTPAQWQTLRATGTSHLLAISGLHLGLVAVLVFLLTSLIVRRFPALTRRVPTRLVAAGAGLLAALVYAALAGFSLPTQRALIMLAAPLLALLSRRRLGVGAALGLAAVVVTLITPLAVLSASFWLSFGAVCALAWGLVGHRGRGWLRPQWVVFLGLIPLLALFFGRIPLLGPVANLVAIPVVGWLAVPPALTGAIAELLHAGWGTPLFRASAFVLAHLWPLLEWLQARSFATVAASPPLWALAAAVLGVVLLLAPRGLGVRLAGLGLLVPLFWPPVPTIAPGNYRVTVLDVGQGLAAVVRTAHHVLLIDTGPRWWGGNDAGRSIVIPYLQARGVRAPNKVVLSHADSDHSGGLASIERQWPGLAVLSGAAVAAHPCHRGEHWRWDGVDFRLLGPDRNRPGTRNNRSCVLKVSAPGGSVLFPSDIERDGEQDLLDDGARLLAAQVLIAPHHGSTTSSTLAFVRAVHPRYVVFSTGYHNRYHFPRPAVVARYRLLGARLLNTAHAGAITFVVNSAHGVRLVARYRMAYSHPWNDP